MMDNDTLLLIASSPRQHTPALQRAFDLARRGDMPVHICLLAHDALIDRGAVVLNPDLAQLARRQFVGKQREWLDGLVARWSADGLAVTGEVVWAPVPHEAILAKILQLSPALVVKDVGRDSMTRRILATAVDWRLLRYSPAPLLLVHDLSTHLPHRILAAVDTGPQVTAANALNERVVREALKFGDLADADVEVAHAFPFLPLEGPEFRALERIYTAARDADLTSFTAFAAQLQVPPECRHWVEGNPVSELSNLVKAREIDLLVLGSTYRSAIERLLLGSTAENLLFQIPCDVLLVKPRDFRRELEQHLDVRSILRRTAQANAMVTGEAPAQVAVG